MPKHKLTFERTITETITAEVDLPEGVTDQSVQGWAEYGFSGRSPFDAAPEQFPAPERTQNKWRLINALPALAVPPPAAKTKRRRKRRGAA